MSSIEDFLDTTPVQFSFDSNEETVALGKLFKKQRIPFIFNDYNMPQYILDNPEQVIARMRGGTWWCTIYEESAGVLIKIKDFL